MKKTIPFLTAACIALILMSLPVFADNSNEKLSVPVITYAKADDMKLTVKWNKTENATHYLVYIYDESNVRIAAKRTTKTNLTYTLSDYGTYKIKVSAEIRVSNKTIKRSAKRVKTIDVSANSSVGDRMVFGGKNYKLTFCDEFNGTELDRSKWNYCPEWKRQDLNNYWSNSMTSLDGNGNLLLSIDKSGDKYLTGAIRTKGIFEQTYGYFETRCKLTQIEGYWGAFWLMYSNNDETNNSGADGTEIDIFESAYINENKVGQALHWDGYGENHKSVSNQVTKDDLYDGYHTFALEWTKDEYRFYVDGEITWKTSGGGICQVPLFIKLTAETGTWTGTPDLADLPDSMVVDYVRVYQG